MILPCHESGDFTAFRIRCKQFGTNSYVLTEKNKYCVLIDCIIDETATFDFLEQHGLQVDQVFCTHGHFDHIGCAYQIQKKYGSQVFLNYKDIKLARMSNFLLMACGSKSRIKLPTFTNLDGGFYSISDDRSVEVSECPGHTNGSVIIFFQKMCFTGDTIFGNDFVRSDLPGESTKTLQESVKALFPRIINSERAFPGHGNVFNGKDLPEKNVNLMTFLDMDIV